MAAACEKALRENVVDQWKNIPRPLCDSTSAILHCVDCLRKLAGEHDDSLLSLSHKHEEMRAFSQKQFSAMRIKSQQLIDESELRLQDRIAASKDNLEQYIVKREIDLENRLKDLLGKEVSANVGNLKKWFEKAMKDKLEMVDKREDRKLESIRASFNVPSLIGRKQCVFSTYGDFVRGQFSAHENNLERLKDHMKHLGNLDKSNAMLLEKMSFMETHFIDVREDLNKRLNEQVLALSDKISRTREEISEETRESITALGYGDNERSLVSDLRQKWNPTFQVSLRLDELTKT